jgi:malonyl-CoA O-methyltransferase
MPTAPRFFDAQAAQHQLTRLSRAAQPPWLHGEVAKRMAERLPLIRLQPQRLLNWWSPLSASAQVLAAAYPQAQRDGVEGASTKGEKNHTRAAEAHEKTLGRSQVFSAPSGGPAQSDGSGGTNDLTPGRSQVFSSPPGGLAQSDRSGGTLNAPSPWWALKSWWPGSSGATQAGLMWDEAEAIESGAQLIWANMVLHSVADPLALMQRWHSLIEVDGFVMFSGLGPGSLLELRSIYKQHSWPTPAAAFVDMHDLGDMLIEAGFSDPVMDQETLTLHWASPEKLLAELRTLGGNTAPDRFAACRTPRWREKLTQALQAQLADAQGRLALTFEVVYGHAFKAAPRWKVGEQTHVPLHDLRASLRRGRTL